MEGDYYRDAGGAGRQIKNIPAGKAGGQKNIPAGKTGRDFSMATGRRLSDQTLSFSSMIFAVTTYMIAEKTREMTPSTVRAVKT